ncbi:hypothetical protein RHMOL_Rhmol05G0181000 [Rhododendron molle]|uniref:Uncharacterized protein n=2 Tax=Rhododendron molle TaxID=49168 RepID=A0ACC0NSN8_RHOML|nr:hypothetical protein RHMOL_Rhmol05G0181000 [Rhododendron molle]KAI8555554.1 hypothetical protein RHMOL_Rhmol05G0181000 [Rhododendron molle]
MDELYRLHSISFSNDVTGIGNFPNNSMSAGFHGHVDNMLRFETVNMEVAAGSEISDLVKAQIANHPLYPNLVSAYIECRKVGAPPEMASLLEEIGKENLPISNCCEIGADPELDEFMESYCEVLHKYKEELSKPFDEATTFLSNIESQLSNLCKETLTLTSGNIHSGNNLLSLPLDPFAHVRVSFSCLTYTLAILRGSTLHKHGCVMCAR